MTQKIVYEGESSFARAIPEVDNVVQAISNDNVDVSTQLVPTQAYPNSSKKVNVLAQETLVPADSNADDVIQPLSNENVDSFSSEVAFTDQLSVSHSEPIHNAPFPYNSVVFEGILYYLVPADKMFLSTSSEQESVANSNNPLTPPVSIDMAESSSPVTSNIEEVSSVLAEQTSSISTSIALKKCKAQKNVKISKNSRTQKTQNSKECKTCSSAAYL